MNKFHINKHGVPAPCKAQKGNCPLGGAESHFDSQQEAQIYADNQNENEFGSLPEMKNQEKHYGNYLGNYHTMSKNANENLSQPMNESNAKEVFDNGFKDGDISVEYEKFTREKSPITFDYKVSKIGDNEYEVSGNIKEYEFVEKDFDTKEEFDEYMKEDPDTAHEVNYKFTGDEMKDALVKYEMIKRDTHPSQTSGVITSGLYHMTREKIKQKAALSY